MLTSLARQHPIDKGGAIWAKVDLEVATIQIGILKLSQRKGNIYPFGFSDVDAGHVGIIQMQRKVVSLCFNKLSRATRMCLYYGLERKHCRAIILFIFFFVVFTFLPHTKFNKLVWNP